MTSIPHAAQPLTNVHSSWRPSANLVTLSSTILVCALLYAGASWKYYDQGFFTLYYFIGLLRDNAYLGIAAVGESVHSLIASLRAARDRIAQERDHLTVQFESIGQALAALGRRASTEEEVRDP